MYSIVVQQWPTWQECKIRTQISDIRQIWVARLWWHKVIDSKLFAFKSEFFSPRMSFSDCNFSGHKHATKIVMFSTLAHSLKVSGERLVNHLGKLWQRRYFLDFDDFTNRSNLDEITLNRKETLVGIIKQYFAINNWYLH